MLSATDPALQIVRCWEGGLTGLLLAVSAETSKWMENAGCLLSTGAPSLHCAVLTLVCIGKEVVTASRERVKDAVSRCACHIR